MKIGGKILVYSGSWQNGKAEFETEVLDLKNDNVVCDPFSNGTDITGTSGGKINNDYVYCGGVNNDKCYMLGQNTPIEDITMSRPTINNFNGAVILPNNTLFIIGL